MELEPIFFQNKTISDGRGLVVDLDTQVKEFNFSTVHQCYSLSKGTNTIRGLHFQTGKYSQSKIVSCVSGSLIDVVVNIDKNTSDFARVYYFSLNGLDGNSIYVPNSFAHGFITRSPDTIVHYSFDNVFQPECAETLSFFDPDLNIELPLEGGESLMSDSDRTGLKLSEASRKFELAK